MCITYINDELIHFKVIVWRAVEVQQLVHIDHTDTQCFIAQS